MEDVRRPEAGQNNAAASEAEPRCGVLDRLRRSFAGDARVLLKLLQHLLIWLAASAVIVVGASWGYVVGFTSHRPGAQVMAWTIATVTVIFAAALVQRAPTAIVALVTLCIPLFAFGAWLTTDGAVATGIGYMLVSATYVACLGPSCRQWLTSRDSQRGSA